MKELHTTKPLILGIIGIPGAGKTNFAKDFSSMFGAPALEVDGLRRNIFGERAPTKVEEAGILRAYWSLAGELIKSKHTFILDGSLHAYAYRSEVRNLAKKSGYDILWLWVQTSESVAQERSTSRNRGSTNTILTIQEFTKAVTSFEPPRANEEYIVTSGQRNFSSQVRPILAKLAQVHESKLKPVRPTDRTDERPPRRNIFIR